MIRKRKPQSKSKRPTRYAAMLLFQRRVVVGRQSAARRLCEQRIINFVAANAAAALSEAKRRGRAAEFRYRDSMGDMMYFECVGVLDLQDLGAECGPDEVWYQIVELVKPSERRKQLCPPESRLRAFYGEHAQTSPLPPSAVRPARAPSKKRASRGR